MSRSQHADVTALVLAAGQGTRMNSDLAKVLHEVAGRPLLAHVLATLEALGVGRTIVVVGHQRERVQQAFADAGVEWVVQERQCGTGHAVRVAAPALDGFEGTLLVVCGDTPLLRAATLDALLAHHARSRAAATVLSMRLPDPKGYGRIVRGALDTVEAIVEERDATAAQRAIEEVNSGVYAFDWPKLAQVLPALVSHNAQGEFYLTDALALMRSRGWTAGVVCAADAREVLGINTPGQLAEAEAAWHALRGGGG